MEAPKAPESSPELSIVPAKFEIVLAEDAGGPLSFVSPPLKDISEMAELERSCFSLNQDAKLSEVVQQGVKQRLYELLQKSDRFNDSATFHNRLANLQRVLGNLAEEMDSLDRAASIDSHVFFKRKLGESFLRSGDKKKASDIFQNLAVGDSYSALRFASLHVLNNDIDTAEEWVLRAVELEPESYAARLFQGAIRLYKNDFLSAIRLFWIALTERPNSSVAYSNLALAYLGENKVKSAFHCLKRSVALDPFNRSAILALADVGHVLKRDADVVPSLRYFVQFEQRETAVWGRLARSLLRIDAVDECIGALKRQGALERSISVWNNLGVAYARKGLKRQSLEAFKYAVTVEAKGGSREELIAARNTAQLISTLGKPDLLQSVTQSIVSSDTNFDLARDEQLCDIYAFHISALLQRDKKTEAIDLAMSLLERPDLGGPLAKWLFQSLSGIFGLDKWDSPRLSTLIDLYVQRGVGGSEDVGLINNVSFAMAEAGRLDEAEACLALCSHSFHKHAYLTATLGLLNFRRGKFARGEELYREAIALASSSKDKTRIRQKLNLEIGRAFARTEPLKSKRALQKVIKEKRGEEALSRQALLMLKLLE